MWDRCTSFRLGSKCWAIRTKAFLVRTGLRTVTITTRARRCHHDTDRAIYHDFTVSLKGRYQFIASFELGKAKTGGFALFVFGEKTVQLSDVRYSDVQQAHNLKIVP
jgi:hypothetical protein